MADVTYPSGLELGLAKGIPAAIDSYFRSQDMTDRRRRLQMLEEAERRAQQQYQEQQGLLAQAPQNLRRLLAPGGTTAGLPPIPGSEPAAPTGLEVGVTPGVSTPGGPGAGATPRSLREALTQPGGAEALIGLERAGVRGLDLTRQIETEERARSGRKKASDAMTLFKEAKTPEDRVNAVGQFYHALVESGETKDIGPFMTYIDTERERGAMQRDVERFGKNLFSLGEGGVEDGQKRLDMIDQVLSAESKFFRTKGAEITAGMLTNVMGPEGLIARTYSQLRLSGMKPLEAWRKIELSFPRQAADMVSNRRIPREVASELEIDLAARKTEAVERGRRAAIPKEERQLYIDLKQTRLDLLSGKKIPLKTLTGALANIELITEGLTSQQKKQMSQNIGRLISKAMQEQEEGGEVPQPSPEQQAELRKRADEAAQSKYGKRFMDLTPEQQDAIARELSQ